jgi:hypothetical protein
MAPEYYIDVYSRTGTRVGIITDFLELSYSKRVNAPGSLTFRLTADHTMAAYLEANDQSQLRVYRCDADYSIDWYEDFEGLNQREVYSYSNGLERFTCHAPGRLFMLNWDIVPFNYPVIEDTPVETVLKTLAGLAFDGYEGSLAAQVTLVRDTGETLRIEANQARGVDAAGDFTRQQLLAALQRAAKQANDVREGGDFDLVRSGDFQWDFNFYPGQRGTDRTDTVRFGTANGSVLEAEYDHDRTGEFNHVYATVGNTTVGQSTATSTNHKTTVVSGTSTNSDTLSRRADEELEYIRARKVLRVKPAQAGPYVYGRDYCVGGVIGDIVTVSYHAEEEQKVVGVDVTFSPGSESRESIGLVLESSPTE